MGEYLPISVCIASLQQQPRDEIFVRDNRAEFSVNQVMYSLGPGVRVEWVLIRREVEFSTDFGLKMVIVMVHRW